MKLMNLTIKQLHVVFLGLFRGVEHTTFRTSLLHSAKEQCMIWQTLATHCIVIWFAGAHDSRVPLALRLRGGQAALCF